MEGNCSGRCDKCKKFIKIYNGLIGVYCRWCYIFVSIFRNYFYLWGCLWVVKVFFVLWGRNLVGCVIGKILVNNDCIKVYGDVNSWIRFIYESYENLFFTNRDDFIVYVRV